uniref:Uncharacterized protein n=1 Tax=Arundo donax TaxID=35708 RepID=A0A0A9G3N0_ARUDO
MAFSSSRTRGVLVVMILLCASASALPRANAAGSDPASVGEVDPMDHGSIPQAPPPFWEVVVTALLITLMVVILLVVLLTGLYCIAKLLFPPKQVDIEANTQTAEVELPDLPDVPRHNPRLHL